MKDILNYNSFDICAHGEFKMDNQKVMKCFDFLGQNANRLEYFANQNGGI